MMYEACGDMEYIVQRVGELNAWDRFRYHVNRLTPAYHFVNKEEYLAGVTERANCALEMLIHEKPRYDPFKDCQLLRELEEVEYGRTRTNM